MSTLKQVALKHGGTIEDDSAGDHRTYQCIAPKGSVWKASGSHMLIVDWIDPSEKTIMIEDAIDRMNYGTERCDTEDCEIIKETVTKNKSVKARNVREGDHIKVGDAWNPVSAIERVKEDGGDKVVLYVANRVVRHWHDDVIEIKR